MPTVNFDKKYFFEVLGKRLSDEELLTKVPMIGVDFKGVDEKKVSYEVFPNRPDMLSESGFARAIRNFLGIEEKVREYKAEKSGTFVKINSNVKNIRPYVACAIVKGLKLNNEQLKEIINLQEKLHITFGRGRRKVAIGIYPLEHINLPISYEGREAKDIRFVPLGWKEEASAKRILEEHPAGKEFGHLLKGFEKYPVWVDSSGKIMSLAPIINSEFVGRVTTNTKEVFVEASGTNFETLQRAISILVCTLIDMGGEAYSVELRYSDGKRVSPALNFVSHKLDLDYVNKLLGLKLSWRDVRSCLERMGIKSIKEGVVLIPTYRADILHMFDLVEDVAIGYGYERFSNYRFGEMSVGGISEEVLIEQKIASLLNGLRFEEVFTFSLIGREDLEDCNFRFGREELIEIENPKAEGYNFLRPNLIINLMKTLSINTHNSYPQNLFEIGYAFGRDGKKVYEDYKVAGCVCSEDATYTVANQVVNYLFGAFGISVGFRVPKISSEFFFEGRVAEVVVGGRVVGAVGEVNPEVLYKFGIYMPTAVFEIDLGVFLKN